MKDGRPFFMAGLWSDAPDPATGEVADSYTVIITDANAAIRVHDRMPAILSAEAARQWLEPGPLPPELLGPYPAEEMTAWRVGDDAKNSRIEPTFRADRGVTLVTATSAGAAQGPGRACQARRARPRNHRHDGPHFRSLDDLQRGRDGDRLGGGRALPAFVRVVAGQPAGCFGGRTTMRAEIEDMAQAMRPSVES